MSTFNAIRFFDPEKVRFLTVGRRRQEFGYQLLEQAQRIGVVFDPTPRERFSVLAPGRSGQDETVCALLVGVEVRGIVPGDPMADVGLAVYGRGLGAIDPLVGLACIADEGFWAVLETKYPGYGKMVVYHLPWVDTSEAGRLGKLLTTLYWGGGQRLVAALAPESEVEAFPSTLWLAGTDPNV